MKKYEELFYKAAIIIATLTTLLLAIYEIKKIGTISGLTFLPFLALLLPYFIESVVKEIKSMWDSIEEEDAENE